VFSRSARERSSVSEPHPLTRPETVTTDVERPNEVDGSRVGWRPDNCVPAAKNLQSKFAMMLR
jgi:hypothetical protein